MLRDGVPTPRYGDHAHAMLGCVAVLREPGPYCEPRAPRQPEKAYSRGIVKGVRESLPKSDTAPALQLYGSVVQP